MAWKKSSLRTFGWRLLSAIGLLSCVFSVALVSSARTTPYDRSNKVAVAEAGSEPPTPEFKVQSLFNGLYRDGEWVSLRVYLHNGSQPWRGEVRATLTYSPDSSYSYNRQIELAPDEESRFFLYIIPTRFEPRVEVNLFNNTGKQIATEQVRVQQPVGVTDYIVGVVSDPERVGQDRLPRPGVVKIRQSDTRTVFLPLSPLDLPDRSDALNTLDAIILSNLKPESLSPGQWQILANWVQDGGKLWLSGGTSFPALATTLDPALVAAQTNGTIEVNRLNALTVPDTALAGLAQKLVLQQLVPQPGTVVTMRREKEPNEAIGLPLVVSRTVERGTVVATAFDLLGAPFVEAGKANAYWSALADSAVAVPDVSYLRRGFFDNDTVTRLLAGPPPEALLDPSWLLAGMAVYCLFLFGGSYYLTCRLNRPLIALALAPGLALPLAGLVWVWGLNSAPAQVSLNRLAVANFYTNSPLTSVKTLGVSIGSGMDRDEYTLELNESRNQNSGWVYRPQTVTTPSQQLPSIPPQTISYLPRSSTRLQSSFNHTGQLQAFGSQGLAENQLPVETDLKITPDGSGLTGNLVNQSNLSLSNVILVLGENYLTVGDLPAGESRRINFPLKRQPAITLRQSVERGLYGSKIGLRGVTSEEPVDFEQWKRNLRWTTLNAAYTNGRFLPLYQNYGLYLTGWLEGEGASRLLGGARLVDNSALNRQDTAFVVKALPFTFQTEDNPARLIVPAASLFANRLTATDISFTPTDNSAKLNNGSTLILQYRLPSTVQAQPTRLSVLVNSHKNDRNGPVSNPQLEIYNWAQQDWRVISSQGDSRSQIDLVEAGLPDYIGPDGFVKIKAVNKGEVHILQQLNFEFEGLRQ